MLYVPLPGLVPPVHVSHTPFELPEQSPFVPHPKMPCPFEQLMCIKHSPASALLEYVSPPHCLQQPPVVEAAQSPLVLSLAAVAKGSDVTSAVPLMLAIVYVPEPEAQFAPEMVM